jgi:hypothetical protein
LRKKAAGNDHPALQLALRTTGLSERLLPRLASGSLVLATTPGKSSTSPRRPLKITPPSSCSRNWRSRATPTRTSSFQDAVLDGVLAALGELAQRTRELEAILVVGAPLRASHALFNCAVVLHRGQLRGVAPKSYLPNYREFYEKRHFATARAGQQRTVSLRGVDVLMP